MRVNTNPLIKSCGTRTDPAAETKSIGLPSDALVPCFLLAIWTISSWHETFIRHPDLVPPRQIVVTSDFSTIYQDLQKPRHRDADGNSPNRRAVSGHVSKPRDQRLPICCILTVSKFVDKFNQPDRLDNLVKITPANLNNTSMTNLLALKLLNNYQTLL